MPIWCTPSLTPQIIAWFIPLGKSPGAVVELPRWGRRKGTETFDITIRPEELAYCPRCGKELSWKEVGGKHRRHCQHCGHVFFVNLKMGAGVIVVEEGKILLTQRAIPPGIGKWCLPAGFVEYDESPQEAACRECREETGLVVELEGLFGVYHYHHEPNERGVLILYAAHRVGGTLQAGDDAQAVDFFPLEELPPIAFRSHREALAELKEGRRAAGILDS